MVLSMERWIGKVVIVTGASAGIGAAIVRQLVDEGMVVVGLARRIHRMEEIARDLFGKKGTFHPIKCDISVEEEIVNAFQHVIDNLGPIHVLINNAGIAQVGNDLCTGEAELWKKTIDVNVLGLCICTKLAITNMRANEIDGHIIHINSVLGHRVPSNFPINIYAATKAAVTHLAEILRLELNAAKSNIKITSLSPGITLTEIFEASGTSYDSMKTVLGGQLHYVESEDIANGVVYVLSTPPHVLVSELTIRPMHDELTC